MSPANGRRLRSFVFLTVAAYMAVIGVATGIMLEGSASGRPPAPTILLTVLVVLFGASIPVGGRPWARTPRALFITLGVDLTLIAALLFLVPNPRTPAILFLVFIPISSRLGRPFRYVCYAAAPLLTLIAVLTDGYLAQQWISLASMVTGFIAMAVFVESYRAVRESSQETNRLLNELVSAQEQLRGAAVVAERQRLAQEMHDAVGHRLTAASIHLEAVCKLIESDPARAGEHAAISREQVRAGLTELRSAVSSLAAPALEPSSLRRRIAETVSVFRAGGGVEVSTDLDPAADGLDVDAATVLLRCVQEGLTNVQKHAPGARARVDVTVLREEGRVELVVEDAAPVERPNGVVPVASMPDYRAAQPAGLPAAGGPTEFGSGGFGLRSLRERAAAVGGTLEFLHTRSGSRLFVALPVPRR